MFKRFSSIIFLDCTYYWFAQPTNRTSVRLKQSHLKYKCRHRSCHTNFGTFPGVVTLNTVSRRFCPHHCLRFLRNITNIVAGRSDCHRVCVHLSQLWVNARWSSRRASYHCSSGVAIPRRVLICVWRRRGHTRLAVGYLRIHWRGSCHVRLLRWRLEDHVRRIIRIIRYRLRCGHRYWGHHRLRGHWWLWSGSRHPVRRGRWIRRVSIRRVVVPIRRGVVPRPLIVITHISRICICIYSELFGLMAQSGNSNIKISLDSYHNVISIRILLSGNCNQFYYASQFSGNILIRKLQP